MEVKEVEELTTKMNEMDNILKQNIFTNPIKESNEKIRQEILALKSILKKNIEEFSNQINSGNINIVGKKNDEEINDIKTALEHKTYQVEILKKAFNEYESKSEEQIEFLKNENAKLKYRINILLKTIEELENKK